MDEAITSILEGCKMAKFLEASLPNMANQPDHLFSTCTEIIRLFSKAKEKMSKSKAQVILGHEPHEQHHHQLEPIASGNQELIRSSHTHATDLLHAQILGGRSSALMIDLQGLFSVDAKMKGVVEDQEAGGTLEEVVREMGGRSAPKRSLRSTDEGEVDRGGAEAAPSGSGPRGSSSQRQRRRSDGGDRRVERVAAPRMGNTEIPPEDGYTWRKYGQKAILGATFPRSYFRCTHQKLYKCLAKKQVQRLDNDPNFFEITYRGDHTCHLSSTAPSVPPPPSTHHHHQQQISTAAPLIIHPDLTPSSTSVPMTQWLSMEISTRPEVAAGMQLQGDFVGTTIATTNIVNLAAPSTSGGPYGGDHFLEYLQQQPPVADMADAMFNSGSSSNNSIDLIFSSMDDKWDSGDKKN